MQRLIIGAALAGALIVSSIVPVSAQNYGHYHTPPGSYQQSCINISMHGSTLSASCTAGSGGRVYSSLDVSRCGGSNVINSNGYLQCSGNGYNNGNGYYNNGHHHHNGYYNNGYGYGNGSLPPGSYENSCTNIRMNGSTLSASCTSGSGQRVYSSINANRCQSRGSNIRNDNGYLRCS